MDYHRMKTVNAKTLLVVLPWHVTIDINIYVSINVYACYAHILHFHFLYLKFVGKNVSQRSVDSLRLQSQKNMSFYVSNYKMVQLAIKNMSRTYYFM